MRSEATLKLKPSKEESKFVEYLAFNKDKLIDIKVIESIICLIIIYDSFL